MNSAHTFATCPLRSMAWVTVDQAQNVCATSKELIDILGYSPMGDPINTVWRKRDPSESSLFYVTTNNRDHHSLTLCVCAHPHENGCIKMACLDVTNLEKMYETNKTSANSTVIMRLTMYGTVDAYYSNGNTTIDLALIGSPIMRFTHPDDVVHLCAGLSQATKTTVANFTLRCRFGTAEAPWEPFHFTAIARSNNIMCLIQPTISLPDQAHSTLHVKAHRRFWKTKSKTISTIAKNLMHLLMILLQLWTTSPKHVVWFDVRSVVQLAIAEAKARPEIRRLLDLLAWAGLIRQPNTTQSRFEAVADHKSTWLVTWPASSTICCDAL